MTELNTLILERFPTSPPPDWRTEIRHSGLATRHRKPGVYCETRGAARDMHTIGIHYVGDVFGRAERQYVPTH